MTGAPHSEQQDPLDAWLPFLLAFVGGYGDAAGFVLARTFTGHTTGNLVLTAIALAGRDWRGTIIHLLAIGTFFIAVALSELIARTHKTSSSQLLLPIVMSIEVILIAAAYWTLQSGIGFRLEVFVMWMSLALGLQNGALRRAGGVSVHTTYLTGVTTSLVAAATDRYISRMAREPMPAADPTIKVLSTIWIAFFLGAGTGAAMIFRFQHAGILGMALILFVAVGGALIGRARPINAVR
jgi:uncharacterized membrane protein YoaK (UPF0700 family)